MYSFTNLKPICCSMSCSNCCFLTNIYISKEVWYSHLFKNFPQFLVIHTKALVQSMKQKQMYFWNSLVSPVCRSGSNSQNWTWNNNSVQFSSVQSLSHIRLFATPWTGAHQVPLSSTISQSLLKLMSIELVMISNHLILCSPLLILPLLSLSIRVFSNVLALCIRQSKYQSFNFSISPSDEYSGLISFRIDWFDCLAVQGTLKSLLQHDSLKTSTLWCSALFMVQLSQRYVTTGKTIALTRWTFIGKVMSLLFKFAVQVCYSLPSKKQGSSNFMATVTVCREGNGASYRQLGFK